MIAIITGDIINSENHPSSQWIDLLKNYFNQFGASPMNWEIYRGDEFQLKVTEKNALFTAIRIKAMLKSIKGLDVRMGVGIGLETYIGTGVTESNGPAYQRSGRNFETLKESKVNLSIATGDTNKDRTLNLMLRLALDFMDDWSVVSAEIVTLALDYPQFSQKEIAQRLGIKQSAVSQRLKRARLDLVLDVLSYYKELITVK
ncbi:SatD family protein [Maribacter sp. Hel_I_7]|uniref:SatD family protein n=1 Tax=Maribacter sp. Hel_I_7 TaxID=1249997 RepID=UPI00047ABABE|nr:SatD family protein [Maribacter sp. Hel_I_7]|eukprot:TRINITY_DN165_c0_g1_i1.p2 TRINITY_DN165_c0_g1~~TRINITY_DN165_c0_g1_i1.p2  ORF type:complete len:202 (+),score=29.40 TRINITY_DN165_c0_g1_i1:1228-1833(+)